MLMPHQQADVEYAIDKEFVFNTNEPGTGKTLTAIETFKRRKDSGRTHKAIVIAPKSLLLPAWQNDIKKFAPEVSFAVSKAPNYLGGFKQNADITALNNSHHSIRWLWENRHVLDPFSDLYVDESTAFKHHTSLRSKYLANLAPLFIFRYLMTGTPSSLSILELWHQIFLLDQGETLGKSFYKYRWNVCDQIPQGMFTKWIDKPGIEDVIGTLIAPFTLNRKLDDCVSIPDNHTYTVPFTLNDKHLGKYGAMQADALLELDQGDVTAVNAAVLHDKLLQIASGAIYHGDGSYTVLDTQRYELIMDLVESREQCVISFNWRHQRNGLIAAAEKRKLTYGIIDGSTTPEQQNQTVNDFQAGNLRMVLMHPRSGAHGLTLTSGTTCIWTSPTTEPERFEQLNRRIYRKGQTRKTETILVSAEETLEPAKYEQLQGRIDRAMSLRDILNDYTMIT